MAEIIDDSKIFPFFLPSLSHLASVKIALSLFSDLGGITSDIQLEEITENSTLLFKKDQLSKCKAKHLTFISRLLRKQVSEATSGLINTAKHWPLLKRYLSKLKKAAFILHFRSDGTVDTPKTVQPLCLDESIDIQRRFQIACDHGFEEIIRILWAEMEASGQAENYHTTYRSMDRFWVRWMRGGYRPDWRQAIKEQFKNDSDFYPRLTEIRWFFPLLETEQRQKILQRFIFLHSDDFRLCVNTLTTKEEAKLLRRYMAKRLLSLCLDWPLQSLFLPTAEKVWNYLDYDCFTSLISDFDYQNSHCKGFDFCELFELFWNKCPDSWKESAKKKQYLREIIHLFLDKIRQKKESKEKTIDLCRMEIRRKSESKEKAEERVTFNKEPLD